MLVLLRVTKLQKALGFSTVWYDSRAIANILGLSDLKDKYSVAFGSEHEDTFEVHMEDKIIQFKCNKDRLYKYEVSDEYIGILCDQH